MKLAAAILAAGFAAKPVLATWDRAAIPFPVPQTCNNECTVDEKNGFDWVDLSPGAFDKYKDFIFEKFNCANVFDKRDHLHKRTFQPKCIVGDVSKGKGKAPKFSHGKKGFSVVELEISLDVDIDVEFHYVMPGGGVCKETRPCKKDGTVVKNTQCGGAREVTFKIPDYEKKDKCSLGIHKIRFDCAPPVQPPVPPVYPPPPETYTPPPVYTPPPAYTPPPPVTSETPPPPPATSETPPAPPVTSEPPAPPPSSEQPAPSTAPEQPPPEYSQPLPETSAPPPPPETSAPPPPPESSATPPPPSSAITYPIGNSSAPAVPTPPASTPIAPPVVEPPPGSPSVSIPVAPPVVEPPPGSTPVAPPVEEPTTTGSPPVSTPVAPPVVEPPPGTPSVSTPVAPPVEESTTGAPPVSTPIAPPVVEPPPSSEVVPTETPAPPPDYSQPPAGSTPPAPQPPVSSAPSPPPLPPTQSAECPMVAQCVNTFLFMTSCKDNTDKSCYCPNKEFMKSVIDCVLAHTDDFTTRQVALTCMTSVCADFIPENPGIITDCPTSIPIGQTATTPPPGPPATSGAPAPSAPGPVAPPTIPVTTVTLKETITVPCTFTDGPSAGATIPSSTTTSVLETAVTVPQYEFQTQTVSEPGASPTENVDLFPPSTPAPINATPTSAFPFPTTFGTGVFQNPTGSATFTPPAAEGAASMVEAGSVAVVFAVIIAALLI